MVADLCAASPIAPPPPIHSASIPPATLFLPAVQNVSFLFFIAFLPLGLATSYPRMLKLKVSFKSRSISRPGLPPAASLYGRSPVGFLAGAQHLSRPCRDAAPQLPRSPRELLSRLSS